MADSLCRQPDLYDESPGSSEYSTGSTLVSHTANSKTEQTTAEIVEAHQDLGPGSQSIPIGERNDLAECDKDILSGGTASQGNVMSYRLSVDISIINFSIILLLDLLMKYLFLLQERYSHVVMKGQILTKWCLHCPAQSSVLLFKLRHYSDPWQQEFPAQNFPKV